MKQVINTRNTDKKHQTLWKNLFEVILTVLITVAIQFVLLIIEYWNNNKKFDGFFSTKVNMLQSTMIVSLSVIVIVVISQKAISNRESTIIALNAKLAEIQRHLELGTKALYGKYGEIAKNNYVSMFRTLISSFIMDNELVESVQIYQYNAINKNYHYGSRSYKQVAIKINYLIGMAKEGIDINALMQTYFEVDFSVFMDMQEIKQYYQKVLEYRSNTDSIEYKESKNCFIKISTKLLGNLLSKLHKIGNIQEIRDKHFTYYRICNVLISLLSNIDSIKADVVQGTQSEILKDKPEIEKVLISGKRTGILGSILTEDIYSFMNIKSGSYKQKRVYLTNVINFKGEKFIVLITLPPVDWSPKINWNRELSKLMSEFGERYEDTIS